MTYSYLEQQLAMDEGYRRHPYRDTEGKLTIGYGRNLEDRGIGKRAALYMLREDIAQARRDVDAIGFPDLTEARYEVLVNMAFNLGREGLRKFARMRAALWDRDYDRAADEMLDSKWARQVGQRARRLARTMRNNRR